MASSLSLSAGQKIVTNGRLKQSVSRWPYARIPLPDFCRAIADMGLTGIDLMQPAEFEIVRQYGLVCSMGYAEAGTIPKGLNDPANHDAIVAGLTKNIPLAAKAAVPNVITFFGNRRPGLDDAAAIGYCVR
jgi:hydroxypyruvate isomerase